MKRFGRVVNWLIIGIVSSTLMAAALPASAGKKKKPSKKLSKQINLYLASVTETDREVSDTWLKDMGQDAALIRIDALNQMWDITTDPGNTENFLNYSANAIAAPITGDTSNALWPVGEKSDYTAAVALQEALLNNPTVAAEFDINVVNAGLFGGNAPVESWAVEIMPVDNYSPGFLLDRYTEPQMKQIETQWTYTYASPLLKVFLTFMPSDHYQASDIMNPRDLFDEWEEDALTVIDDGPPENCLLEDPDIGTGCQNGYMTVVVLPGLMSDLQSGKNLVDSYVYAHPEGVPCGNSISLIYHVDRCRTNFGCDLGGMGCGDAELLGIDYVSRCVWNKEVTELTHYIVAYQKEAGSLTCDEYIRDPQ